MSTVRGYVAILSFYIAICVSSAFPHIAYAEIGISLDLWTGPVFYPQPTGFSLRFDTSLLFGEFGDHSVPMLQADMVESKEYFALSFLTGYRYNFFRGGIFDPFLGIGGGLSYLKRKDSPDDDKSLWKTSSFAGYFEVGYELFFAHQRGLGTFRPGLAMSCRYILTSRLKILEMPIAIIFSF
jgi:hypothetical protein